MDTKILSVEEGLLPARDIILGGGAVAFPTETVYGLGANAFETAAVESIFAIKGRPSDNPLIVHVHTDYDIEKLVSYIPDYAKALAKAYLPGPLTMVYKSRGTVSSAVSCGLNTLAIRIPSHSGAQKFLRYLDLPIAAPSANISKHVSPVSAQHVYADLNGRIPLILDGGNCSGGIESTVLDCTGAVPVILRSGLISKEMIESVAGACEVYTMKEGEAVRSPGMKYKHYSPRCATELYSYDDRKTAFERYKTCINSGIIAYILCDDGTAAQCDAQNVLNLGKDEYEVAANLYAKLREGEGKAQLIIAIAPQKQDGIMVGVMNRLTKACKSQ